MNRLFQFLIVLLFLCAYSCKNILLLKLKPYYHEKYSFVNYHAIHQSVEYKRPNTIDGGFYDGLTINFLDTATARRKKTLDLKADSTIIQCSASYGNDWMFGPNYYEASGQIKILRWNNDGIKLKEKITLQNGDDKKTKRYFGTRAFNINRN